MLLTFPEFSLFYRILSIVLSLLKSLPSSQPLPPFYSDILESQGNHWFPCFVLWSTGHVPCPSLSRFYSLFFILFFLLASISLKVHGWLPISGYAEVTPFWIPPFGSSSLLPFFPTRWNPILPVWKSFVAIPFFILLYSGSPRRFLLVPWEVADSFLFSCWVVWRLWLSSVSRVSFFCPFFLNCLNLSLIVFIRLGGSEPFGGR